MKENQIYAYGGGCTQSEHDSVYFMYISALLKAGKEMHRPHSLNILDIQGMACLRQRRRSCQGLFVSKSTSRASTSPEGPLTI